jgi:hypothetical protein
MQAACMHSAQLRAVCSWPCIFLTVGVDMTPLETRGFSDLCGSTQLYGAAALLPCEHMHEQLGCHPVSSCPVLCPQHLSHRAWVSLLSCGSGGSSSSDNTSARTLQLGVCSCCCWVLLLATSLRLLGIPRRMYVLQLLGRTCVAWAAAN